MVQDKIRPGKATEGAAAAAANDSNAARADLDTPDVKVIYAQILRAGCTEEVLYSINVRSGKGHHGAILRDTGN